jgi:Large polyvalent protein-associated domain 7
MAVFALKRKAPSHRSLFSTLPLSDDEADELVARLNEYGHRPETVEKRHDGVWLSLTPETKLKFDRYKIEIYGVASDDSIAAAIRHAQDAWGGALNVEGPEEFKLRVWAHAQVAGVDVGNYYPPQHLMREANELVAKYSTEMFNRKLGVYNDGTLGGSRDDRAWGYHTGTPTPREREMMRRVELASGLGRSPEAPTI